MIEKLPAIAGDPGWIPGSGRSPGEGNGNPLQYSCLGSLIDLVGYGPWGYKRVGHDLATKKQPTSFKQDFMFLKQF